MAFMLITAASGTCVDLVEKSRCCNFQDYHLIFFKNYVFHLGGIILLFKIIVVVVIMIFKILVNKLVNMINFMIIINHRPPLSTCSIKNKSTPTGISRTHGAIARTTKTKTLTNKNTSFPSTASRAETRRRNS